jgi:hypothetical protein
MTVGSIAAEHGVAQSAAVPSVWLSQASANNIFLETFSQPATIDSVKHTARMTLGLQL